MSLEKLVGIRKMEHAPTAAGCCPGGITSRLEAESVLFDLKVYSQVSSDADVDLSSFWSVDCDKSHRDSPAVLVEKMLGVVPTLV